MKRKAIYQQILVALGVLVVFIIGLTIGKMTSASQTKYPKGTKINLSQQMESTKGLTAQGEANAF